MVGLIDFLHPGRLWWLTLVAVIALAYLLLNSRTHRGRSPKSRVNLVLPKDSALKRHLSVIAALLAMSALMIAWAQPQAVRKVPRDRATVVVALDVSFSMRADDVQPSRIEAAKQAAMDFIDILPNSMQVSVVLFGGEVTLKTVPSTDHKSVKAGLANAQLVPKTAIGSGIEAALEMIAQTPPDPKDDGGLPPAAIVLLSDGYTNVGPPSSLVAQKAHDLGVPIYTIAFGTPNGWVIDEGKRQPVPVNHAELMAVAKISGGEKYAATSAGELHAIYQSLAESLGYLEQTAEVTDQYAGIALLCAFLSTIGIISLAARWP